MPGLVLLLCFFGDCGCILHEALTCWMRGREFHYVPTDGGHAVMEELWVLVVFFVVLLLLFSS